MAAWRCVGYARGASREFAATELEREDLAHGTVSGPFAEEFHPPRRLGRGPFAPGGADRPGPRRGAHLELRRLLARAEGGDRLLLVQPIVARGGHRGHPEHRRQLRL